MTPTDIPLGFATSRLYEQDGELHFEMWPVVGTVMTVALRGAVSDATIIRNNDNELVVARSICRYTFRFSPREAGPDTLRYSVRAFGLIPLGVNWGDISGEGKRALRTAFGVPEQ